MAISLSSTRFAPQFQFSISKFLSNVFRRIRMQHSRQRLAQLDARALRDIGLSPAQANREAEKPIWDAPDHWLS